MAVNQNKIEIRPQPGKQEQFLSSTADIVIYGGGAFSGKTYAELLEPLRNVGNPNFRCVIFRRTSPQITNPGALWDEAGKIYPLCGGKSYESHPKSYTWPSGAEISFHHLQYDTTVYDWQGAQIPLIEFDELTHFTEKQFFYMLSRNRSDCGVPAYVRATCNPDADSWVATFLQWWWDAETGLPYEDRCGKLRWFVRLNNELHWADSREELIEQFGNEDGKDAKSVTFISASIYDNPIGMAANPNYLASLKALPYVERERLLGRNWKIRATGGNIFKLIWFERSVYRELPTRISRYVRYWDLGGSDSEEADYTVGLLMAKDTEGICYVVDIVRGQWSANERSAQMIRTAESDLEKYGNANLKWYVELQPGNAVDITRKIVQSIVSIGVACISDKPQGKKPSRAQLVSAATESGLVRIPDERYEGTLPETKRWVKSFVNECLAFSEDEDEYDKDDQVDTYSGAYNKIIIKSNSWQ